MKHSPRSACLQMHREHSQYVPHAYASPRAHARTRARRKVDDQVGTPRAPRQPRCCARRSRGSRPPAAGVQCRGAGRAACRWPPLSPLSPWPPSRPPSPSRRPSAPKSAGSPVALGAGAAGCWYNGALPRAQVDPRLRPAAQRRDCAQSGSPPPWAAPPPTCSVPARADGRSEGLPNFFGRWPAKLSASAWSALTRRSRCHFHLSVCASRPRSPSNRSGAAASAVHLARHLLSLPALGQNASVQELNISPAVAKGCESIFGSISRPGAPR